MRERNENEYRELKSFFSNFISRYVSGGSLPSENRILLRLDELEKTSASKALSGPRQAVGDCVEMSIRFDPAEVEGFDNELQKLGFITLSEVRRRYSRTYLRILKRKKIKNLTEYYLVKGVLNILPEEKAEEADLVEKLISDYESQ